MKSIVKVFLIINILAFFDLKLRADILLNRIIVGQWILYVLIAYDYLCIIHLII
jgi:hypothetical protein